MKKHLLPLLLLAAGLNGFAQQDPLYSQYLFNPIIINPAYAGFSKDLTGQAAYRVQWAGFEGAPTTFNATGHLSLADNRMGLGITMLRDEIGSNRTSEIQAVYSYHLPVSSAARFSFGLQGGMVNYANDYTTLTIDRGDPKLQNNISEWAPTIGAGLIFSSENVFLGLSVPKLLRSTTFVDGVDLTFYTQHAYAFLAYSYAMSYRLKLKPFALARFVQGANVNVDFGATLTADDSYVLGLFTRNLNAYGFLAKINLGDNLRIGYIFEMPTNSSVGMNYTTHEITIGFRMRLARFHDINAVTNF